MIPFVFIVLGLCIGSFLNVVILRYNTGKGLNGRSQCFSCARQLTSRDLWPVFSFLFSGGRCRTCKSKISKQYILVEIATAFLFYLAYLHNAPLLSSLDGTGSPAIVLFLIKSILDCIIMSLLVFMAGYDIRHKIIPDAAVFTFSGLALLSSFITLFSTSYANVIMSGGSMWPSIWWLLAAGPLLALPFYLIWLLSGGRWMGLGDAKLALGFGWMLGLALGGTAVFFGFWVGAAYAILIMLLRPTVALGNKLLIVVLAALALSAEMKYGVLQVSNITVIAVCVVLMIPILLSNTPFLKKRTLWGHLPALEMKSEVPFAPFLIIGLLIVYVLGYNLFTLNMWL